jgi:hypothetical protein
MRAAVRGGEQRPGVAAVGGTQNAETKIRVGGVVRFSPAIGTFIFDSIQIDTTPMPCELLNCRLYPSDNYGHSS